MSNNEEGVKMVRFAAAQVEKLAPQVKFQSFDWWGGKQVELLPFIQVLNAARLLAARPQSKVAQDNMDSFAKSWQEKVDLLTLAVDSIITIDDFLAVSGTFDNNIQLRIIRHSFLRSKFSQIELWVITKVNLLHDLSILNFD